MANETRIAQLAVKLLRENLSGPEQKELDGWGDLSPANREFLVEVSNEDTMRADIRILAEMDKGAIQQKINKGLGPVTKERSPIIGLWKPFAAAIFIGAICWMILRWVIYAHYYARNS